MTGRPWATVSSIRRPPQNSSLTGNWLDDRPSIEVTRSTIAWASAPAGAIIGGDLRDGDVRGVLVDDPGSRAGHLGQRPERDPLAVRQAPAGEDRRPRRARRGEVPDEARLPDAWISHDRDEPAGGIIHGALEGALQLGPFGVASDERRFLQGGAGDVTQADHPVGGDPLGLALELQRFDDLDFDVSPHEVVGRLTDEDLVLGRGLLESRGDVDGVARRQLLVGRGIGVGHHFARVDARPIGELDAVEAQELFVELGQLLLHPVGRTDGAQRVVLVGLRDAEHGHDRVADVLLDGPAVALDLGGHDREVALLDLTHRLLVDPLRERGRALQVDEDEGRGLAHLPGRQRGRRQCRAAEPTQPESGGVFLAAVRTGDDLHAPESTGPRRDARARTMSGMAGRTGDMSLAHDALHECRLFAGLDPPILSIVAAALRPRRFRRGETIFHADDPGDALFIVTSGRVKITIPPGDGSEPAILTTIAPGGFFGELALLDGAARSATAVALVAVETQVLRRDAFDQLVDEQPALRRALFEALATEIRRLTVQFGDLHFLDLPGRLARHLLRSLPGGNGEASREAHLGGEQRLPWPYTQGELAGMIGGSRQSVNRLLADFVAQGLLRFEGDDLVIPDAARLAAAARR